MTTYHIGRSAMLIIVFGLVCVPQLRAQDDQLSLPQDNSVANANQNATQSTNRIPNSNNASADPLAANVQSTNRTESQAAREASALRGLVERIRKPSAAEDLEALRKQVRYIFDKQLDRDLEWRAKGLEEIERRAATLRKQLEKRRENKDQTLDLLMMLVENPSAGLGLPDHWLRVLMPTSQSRNNPFMNRQTSRSNYDPFGPEGGDPFGGNSDPFGSGGGSNDPFGGDESSSDPFGG